jgi:hypothetical protein
MRTDGRTDRNGVVTNRTPQFWEHALYIFPILFCIQPEHGFFNRNMLLVVKCTYNCVLTWFIFVSFTITTINSYFSPEDNELVSIHNGQGIFSLWVWTESVNPYSIPGPLMWYLCWIKWNWNRFFSEYLGFPFLRPLLHRSCQLHASLSEGREWEAWEDYNKKNCFRERKIL